MNYKVTFKRFRLDAAGTVVYIEANSAEDAADAVRHYYCVGSKDIISVEPEKKIESWKKLTKGPYIAGGASISATRTA